MEHVMSDEKYDPLRPRTAQDWAMDREKAHGWRHGKLVLKLWHLSDLEMEHETSGDQSYVG
jgi:hypothetical protein